MFDHDDIDFASDPVFIFRHTAGQSCEKQLTTRDANINDEGMVFGNCGAAHGVAKFPSIFFRKRRELQFFFLNFELGDIGFKTHGAGSKLFFVSLSHSGHKGKRQLVFWIG